MVCACQVGRAASPLAIVFLCSPAQRLAPQRPPSPQRSRYSHACAGSPSRTLFQRYIFLGAPQEPRGPVRAQPYLPPACLSGAVLALGTPSLSGACSQPPEQVRLRRSLSAKSGGAPCFCSARCSCSWSLQRGRLVASWPSRLAERWPPAAPARERVGVEEMELGRMGGDRIGLC